MVTTEQIKEIRDKTGVSVMQCKKALEEAGGDPEKALLFLRKKSGEIAAKKSGRDLGAGIVAAYVHGNGSVGTLVELSCETDFVSNNTEFKDLAHDIAMHAAAMNPEVVRREDISEDQKAKVLEVIRQESKDQLASKPEEVQEKIISGKLDAYFQDKALLEQSFIKDPDTKIETLINNAIQKFGEKIEIARFTRFSVLGK